MAVGAARRRRQSGVVLAALLLPLLCLLTAQLARATTWYVRADGGTRYSTNVPSGQCDGTADASYPGSGTNQHCAFNDIRLLWQDGSYAYNDDNLSKFPARGWIGKGGDTYLVHGSLADHTAPYRVGWSAATGASDPALVAAKNPAPTRGWQGFAYAGPPSPPAGTAAQHTRILGEHWQDCHAASARTPVIAGYSVGSAFNFTTSYVDFQCFDISDRSECKQACKPTDDFGRNGISLANTAEHLLLQDVRIHGMRNFGILGPSGNGAVFHYLSLVGNGEGGWNADASDNKTGTGTLLVQHYEIKWNGCIEEFPVLDPLPYKLCTDQNSTGYGDGFGTATIPSKPAWQAHFDQGEVAYNTQDGLDALHLIGNGSSMTVTRTLAYGNMGQQIKVGGASGRAVNNVVVGNCRAMAARIPGTPAGYNDKLSDFCRGDDVAVVITAGRGTLSRFENNTVFAAGTIAVDVECDTSAGLCDSSARLSLQNNVVVGFPRGPATGATDGDGRLPTAFYNNTQAHPFTNRGSIVRGNTVFHRRPSDPCPMGRFDLDAVCADPGLRDETWHMNGFGDMRPLPGSKSAGSGAAVPGMDVDFSGAKRPATPSRGALEPGSPAPSSPAVSNTAAGDAASGGGGDLLSLTVSDAQQFSPSDELSGTEASIGSGGALGGHYLRGLARPVALCTVVVASGAGLFLLGRASGRGGSSGRNGDRV